MTMTKSNALFLGQDLRSLWREVRQAWAHAQDHAPLSWLTPVVPVRLLQADGGESVWLGGSKQDISRKAIKTQLIAVELPHDLVLQVARSLPPIGEADLHGAIALHVQSVSPFSEADLVWGYRTRSLSGGGATADIALAYRRHVLAYLNAQAHRITGSIAPEVWVSVSTDAPIVMQGFGEPSRRVQMARGRFTRYAFLATACALLGAIAITPSFQLRARALDAYTQHEALVKKTAPLVMQREALMKAADGLSVLAELQAARIEPLRVLDKLTRALPDDTALQNLVLKEQKVTITGLTANASALMQLLSEQEGVREVRAPSPAMRSGGDSKENFTIEFLVDPRVFGVSPQMPAPGNAASTPSAAAQQPSLPASGSKS